MKFQVIQKKESSSPALRDAARKAEAALPAPRTSAEYKERGRLKRAAGYYQFEAHESCGFVALVMGKGDMAEEALAAAEAEDARLTAARKAKK